MGQITGTQPTRPPCEHDSTRVDGTLDAHCLRCGADGYWHEGHRHDRSHPSGKVLIRLACPLTAEEVAEAHRLADALHDSESAASEGRE